MKNKTMGYLCFGDSNTYGYDPRGFFGGRYENCWVDLLAAKTGHAFINAGANGREIPRSPSAVGQMDEADSILIMLGTNDLLQGASPQEAAARMEAFLLPLLSHRLLLIAPPPMQRGAWVPADTLVEASVRLGEEYRLLAEKLRIPFIDTHSWNIELAFDGVHFTEAGHRAFADNLIQYL